MPEYRRYSRRVRGSLLHDAPREKKRDPREEGHNQRRRSMGFSRSPIVTAAGASPLSLFRSLQRVNDPLVYIIIQRLARNAAVAISCGELF